MPLNLQTRVELGKNEFTVTGPQLDSTLLVKMTCRYRGDDGPARFIFKDQSVDATVPNIREDADRGLTSIGNGKVLIRQVEHILSALFGMNCLSTDIQLSFLAAAPRTDRISPPICYLNAEDFSAAIRRSFRSRHSPAPFELGHALVVHEKDPENDRDPSYAVVAPLEGLSVTAHINFPHFWGKQIFSCRISADTFQDSLAWARSFFSTPFPHKQEWAVLRQRYPALLNQRADHAGSIMIDYTPQRWITPLRADDEPVRHKVIDILGDLALLGMPLHAGMFVYKPHHRFNRQCVRALYHETCGE